MFAGGEVRNGICGRDWIFEGRVGQGKKNRLDILVGVQQTGITDLTKLKFPREVGKEPWGSDDIHRRGILLYFRE